MSDRLLAQENHTTIIVINVIESIFFVKFFLLFKISCRGKYESALLFTENIDTLQISIVNA
jgi:hypothetical protein